MLNPSFSGLIILRALAFSLLSTLGLLSFLGGYGLLRLLRIPVHWVVRVAGGLIIIASLVFGVWMLTAGTGSFPSAQGVEAFPRDRGVEVFSPARYGNLLGAISTLLALYAALSWAVRHWYVLSKKRAWTSLSRQSRPLFLFVRQHHQFFGLLVVVAALAHMLPFLPALSHAMLYEVITGFIALGTLGIMAILGTWMWIASIRKKTLPRLIQTLHPALAVIFLGALLLHV